MSHSLSWTLPTPGAAATPSGAGADQKLALLGKDLFFNGDYDVTAAGDYVLLEGEDAVRQAIYRRLMTRPGEYKVRPEYGVGMMDFVKRRRLASTLDELRQRVVDQLSLDPRISEVVDIVASTITDGICLKIVVRIAGDTLTFRPFNFTEGPLSGQIGSNNRSSLRNT